MCNERKSATCKCGDKMQPIRSVPPYFKCNGCKILGKAKE